MLSVCMYRVLHGLLFISYSTNDAVFSRSYSWPPRANKLQKVNTSFWIYILNLKQFLKSVPSNMMFNKHGLHITVNNNVIFGDVFFIHLASIENKQDKATLSSIYNGDKHKRCKRCTIRQFISGAVLLVSTKIYYHDSKLAYSNIYSTTIWKMSRQKLKPCKMLCSSVSYRWSSSRRWILSKSLEIVSYLAKKYK